MDPFQESFAVQLGAGGTFLVVPSGKLGVIEHRSTLLGQTKVSGYFITSTIGGGGSAFREVPILTHAGGGTS